VLIPAVAFSTLMPASKLVVLETVMVVPDTADGVNGDPVAAVKYLS